MELAAVYNEMTTLPVIASCWFVFCFPLPFIACIHKHDLDGIVVV